VVFSCVLETVASVDTANYAKNETNDDNDLDELQHAWVEEGVVGLVDVVEEATEETKSCKLNWRHTNAVEDGRSGIEADGIGFADGRELHTRPDNSGETEYDEIQPTGVATKAMLDCEPDADKKTWDVNYELGDRDTISITERHVEGRN